MEMMPDEGSPQSRGKGFAAFAKSGRGFGMDATLRVHCLHGACVLLVVFGAIRTATGEQKVTTDLVAHYAFDEGAGTLAGDGTIRGAAWVETERGVALKFDGKVACVECGHGSRLKLEDKLTISAWICPKGQPSGEPVIAGEDPRYWGITHYKGRVYFYISGGSNYCKVPVPYYRWSHVAGTFDGTTMKLYVDGDICDTRDLPAGTRIRSGTMVRIGGGNRKGAYYNGIIDDVRVYGRALTGDEIAALAVRPGTDDEKLSLTDQQRGATTRFFEEHTEPVEFRQEGRQLWLANRDVGIELIQGDKGFYLSRLYGITADQDFLSGRSAMSHAGLWQLVLRRDQGRDEAEITVTSRSGAAVSSSVDRNASGMTLRLTWNGLAVGDEENSIDVEVAVTLKDGDPLSRWRIDVTNRSKTYGLWNVVFPILELKPIGPNPERNAFIVPRTRGVLARAPFAGPFYSGGAYPGSLNMQFQALFDESGTGLYLAVHDGLGYKKEFKFSPNRFRQIIQYQVGHRPANMGYPAENYAMTYDVCVGPFSGDWHDACQIYRNWALNQIWCSQGPLTVRKDIPRWFKETPIMFSAYMTDGDASVTEARDRMLDFLKFIGTELPVCWYTWKQHLPEMTDYNKPTSPWRVPDERAYPCGNIHDGNYPNLPALRTFSSACKAIGEAGGRVSPYVCSRIYDPGLNENAPLAAQARARVSQDVHGERQSGEGRADVAWRICYHTDWWQRRMRQTVIELINREHAGGIYFDTFYGGRVQCFDTTHGHSHGGGNDPYLGARKLSEVVRGAMKQTDADSVMSGENPAETAIDLLDGFLYARTIRPDHIPLFATVYGDYICRFGREVDPGSDGFYIQCATLFTEGAQMGRLSLSNEDYLKDVDVGSKYTEKMKFLRKLARLWSPETSGRYLAHGQLLRPIRFTRPDPMPIVSYHETGRNKWRISVPALQNGVFRAADGSLGVFVVNVANRPISFRFQLTPDRYPILRGRKYSVADGPQIQKENGEITCAKEIATRDVLFLEARPASTEDASCQYAQWR